jgi:plastocyanin
MRRISRMLASVQKRVHRMCRPATSDARDLVGPSCESFARRTWVAREICAPSAEKRGLRSTFRWRAGCSGGRAPPEKEKKTMRSLILASLVLSAAPAIAENLKGKIDDPSLRRKTELVYVESVPGAQTPPTEPVFVNQHGNTYVPHLTAVVAGTKVIFRSEDPELHNVYARGEKKVLFNDAVLPKMQSQPKVFNDLGVVHLTCNVHKEMSAYILVLQNKYWAKPDKDGTFTIEGLPPGTYTIRVWGEQLSDEQKAKTFKIAAGGAS